MKYINKSVLLSGVILSSIIMSGCTSTQQKFAIDGQQFSIERKATNRAYVDQIKIVEQGDTALVTGVATIHTSTRGPSAGNMYVDLVDFNSQVIKQISKSYNRPSRSKRQFTFNIGLGEIPKNTQKVVIYYAD